MSLEHSAARQPRRFIRGGELRRRLGISRTTQWRLSRRDPDFPRRVQISPGIEAYVEDEVDAYAERLIEERDVLADAGE